LTSPVRSGNVARNTRPRAGGEVRKRIALLFTLVLLTAVPAGAEERIRILRNIVVESGETLDDAVCTLCSVVVRGRLQGDAVALWGSVEVRGSVGGDAVAVGGGVWLGPGVRVGGEAVAVAGPLERDATAQVGGDAEAVPYLHLPGQRQLFWRGAVVNTAFYFLLGLIAYPAVRSRRTANAAAALRDHPWRSLVAGIGVALIFTGLFYLGTFLGRFTLWAEWVVSAAMAALFVVGYVGMALCLGRRLARGAAPFAAVALGALLLALVQLVPVLGLAAITAILLLALGAAATTRLGSLGPASSTAVPAHPAAAL
jgi:hypothetical protein